MRKAIAAWQDLNHNVKLVFATRSLVRFSYGIWNSTTLTAFIYALTDSDMVMIGALSAANGIPMLCLSLCSGTLVDRWGRVRTIRAAVALLAAATTITICAVIAKSVPTLFVGVAFFGLFSALFDPASESIFADSVVTGDRSFVYSMKYSVAQAAYAIGPLVNMIAFAFMGDQWKLGFLQVVMCIGLAINIPLAILMMRFDEKRALGSASEAIQAKHTTTSTNEANELSTSLLESNDIGSTNNDIDDDYDIDNDNDTDRNRMKSNQSKQLFSNKSKPRRFSFKLASSRKSSNASLATIEDDDNNENDVDLTTNNNNNNTNDDRIYKRTLSCWRCCPCVRFSFVPYLIASVNFITGLGAGLSIRFFPVLLFDKYKIGPILVNMVVALSLFGVALFANFAQRLSKSIGRLQAALLAQLFGVTFLFIIAMFPPVAIVMMLFIFRTGTMRAATPLFRAVLMDVVPKRRRGVFNSIENIAWGMTGNTSGILGGWIVENYGYGTVFLMTCAIYVCAMLPILSVLHLVPEEETIIAKLAVKDSEKMKKKKKKKLKMKERQSVQKVKSGSDLNGFVKKTGDESGEGDTESESSENAAATAAASAAIVDSIGLALTGDTNETDSDLFEINDNF